MTRKQSRNNVSCVVFKMASKDECDFNILPEFRNSVKHSEVPGKNDTDKEFLDFEVPSS